MGTLTIDGIVPEKYNNQSEFYLQICERDQAKAAKFFDGTDTVLRSNSTILYVDTVLPVKRFAADKW